MALSRKEAEAEAREAAEKWKQRAIDVLVDLLLDPYDTRPRDRVAQGGNITVRITHTRNPPRSNPEDEVVEFLVEHMVTLDHELRWIPAAPKGLDVKNRDAMPSPFRPMAFHEPTRRQIRTQTTDLDRTRKWDWADLRQSRIRKSLSRNKDGLARPKSVEEMAIDRADLRMALNDCSEGELRALILSAAGRPLDSGERVQKMRALKESSALRKRKSPAMHVVTEGEFSQPTLLTYWQGFGALSVGAICLIPSITKLSRR